MNANVKRAIERLQAGETVDDYKEGGDSMEPILKSRQPVTLSPVDTSLLEKGDIVFVRVRGNVCTHLVSALQPNRVQISNNGGHVNGWTSRMNVFGIVSAIDGRVLRKAQSKILKTKKDVR